ncbi:MAG: ATP-binding cassette domain-containing protein [Spirochaetales bacterium]|nr:ATP-binding cassette domain-containing protein [Spirochaetales bacterium]
MVRLSNVSFGYEKDAKILNNISLSIDTGAFYGIYGKSGCGKTTLAKLICGLLKPDEGTVEVSAKPLMVLQFPERQLFGKTVLEDVMYGPLNILKDKEKAREKAKQTMLKLGLEEELFARSPFSISGGQKRLVALAGILAMDPEILVLDEPTAGLDGFGFERLTAILKDLHAEGKTIILVSHEQDLPESLCTDSIRL